MTEATQKFLHIEERSPLVTFAIFAYNQEKYIRDAVEAALAQTYSPLEIVLSDDCSQDGTFEIMENIARNYIGPHKILLRQSEINLGTALHFSAVAQITTGELLIAAAGDDISLPSRSKEIVDCWIKGEKNFSCIHSYALLFSELGGKKQEIRPGHSRLHRQKIERNG